MGLLTPQLARLRSSPHLFRIPPYLSALCMLGGVIWLFVLPLQQYSRSTYISENALLPGQVHTYFGGSEQNIFRAYRHEMAEVLVQPWTHDPNGTRIDLPLTATDDDRRSRILQLFKNAGTVKTSTQHYQYTSSGTAYNGTNIYGVLHAPRGDGTEAMVLVAPIRNINNKLNLHGVALLLSLARYFKRWSLWSKDIIFLVTPDARAGPQAWIDAYHEHHDPTAVEGLKLKSGSLQGVVGIDYPFEHRFGGMRITYDGVNGMLPNLDLLNTAVTVSSGQMGIPASIQGQEVWAKREHYHHFPNRLRVLGTGMVKQALGQSTGVHSVFMPYHIDAITLTAIDDGWQDEMAFGRTVESIVRSINNLLEKFHQSFFFYLMMQSNRFVSIGTYLPSAMAVAAGFTIVAIAGWVRSGYDIIEVKDDANKADSSQEANGKILTNARKAINIEGKSEQEIVTLLEKNKAMRTKPTLKFVPTIRPLPTPILLLTALHLLSLIPIYILTRFPANLLLPAFVATGTISLLVPPVIANILTSLASTTDNTFVVLKSLSLLLLGLFLTVLATLNFSLSLFLGVLCAPLAFVVHSPAAARLAALQFVVLLMFSPVGIISLLTFLHHAHLLPLAKEIGGLSDWLLQLAYGWNILYAWCVPVGVFCAWWPAWTVGATNVCASWCDGTRSGTAGGRGRTAPTPEGRNQQDLDIKGR